MLVFSPIESYFRPFLARETCRPAFLGLVVPFGWLLAAVDLAQLSVLGSFKALGTFGSPGSASRSKTHWLVGLSGLRACRAPGRAGRGRTLARALVVNVLGHRRSAVRAHELLKRHRLRQRF